MADEWIFACDIINIEIVSTGSQSHNSLGAGESYHAYIRSVYKEVHAEYSEIDDKTALTISVKAINDCTGPLGLCPTLLVFSILPPLPSPSKRSYLKEVMGL